MKKILLFIVWIIWIFWFVNADWIYRDQTGWLISIVYNWSTVLTLQDKNLGATTVYNYWDELTDSNAWWYFQWWNNNIFFPSSFNTTSSRPNVNNYWPWNYYSSNIFVTFYWDWANPSNDNLWGDTTNTLEARQWPCPVWYYVPSYNTIDNLVSTFSNFWFSDSSYAYSAYLKIPLAWDIHYTYWQVSWKWGFWSLRTSTPGSSNWWTAIDLDVWLNSVEFPWYYYRAYGFSVRCFKNSTVSPTYIWTKIYWDDIEAPTFPKFKVYYWNTSYEYDLEENLEIHLDSPVVKNSDTYS